MTTATRTAPPLPFAGSLVVSAYSQAAAAGGRQRRQIEKNPDRARTLYLSNRFASVTDSFGRTHDHENLFVVGSPTLPTGGCTNGTLTFVALALRPAEEIARV